MRAYAEGLVQALGGAGAITEGVSALYSGAGQLADGSQKLTDGLASLASEIDRLKGYLDTIESGTVDEELYAFLVSAAVDIAQSALDESNERVRNRLRTQLEAVMPDATPEEIEAIVDAVIPANATIPTPELTEKQKEEIAAMVARIIQGSGSIQELIGKFDALAGGIDQLADGSAEITSGISALTDGLRELKGGLAAFSEGAAALQENGTSLADGADSIATGIGKIARGLRSLANDGMQRLVDETSVIDVSLSRKDALIDLSQSYSAFSATREPEDGAVQFVLSTEGIVEELPIEPVTTPDTAEPSPSPADTEGETETGFFERIGAWFRRVFAGLFG